jgi:uncharacterized protein YkvS
MKINDVTHAIMFGDFTNEQLNAIGMAVKYRRNQLSREIKKGLSIGDVVKFVDRSGITTTGRVKKVNIKYVIVDTGVSRWRVPANMLEVA